MSKKTKKALFTVLFVLINVLVVYYIAKKNFVSDTEIRFGQIFKLWMTNWPYLIVVILLPIIALIVEGIKYYLMIYHVTGEKRLSVSIKTAIIGKYYDNITPLGSGGQAFQIYYMYQNKIPSGIAGSLSVSAFSMMQIAFTFIAIIVFIFGGKYVDSNPMKIAAYIGSVFAVFIPIVVVIFTFMPKFTGNLIFKILMFLHKIKIVKQPIKKMQSVLKFLKNFKESFAYLTSSARLVIIVFILSLIYQTCLFSIPYFVVRATGVNVDFFQLYSLCVFVYCAVAFIPTPGNSGGAEISFAIIFTILSGGIMFWAMILWRFSSYFFVIFIGFITVISNAVLKNKDKADNLIE